MNNKQAFVYKLSPRAHAFLPVARHLEQFTCAWLLVVSEPATFATVPAPLARNSELLQSAAAQFAKCFLLFARAMEQMVSVRKKVARTPSPFVSAFQSVTPARKPVAGKVLHRARAPTSFSFFRIFLFTKSGEV